MATPDRPTRAELEQRIQVLKTEVASLKRAEKGWRRREAHYKETEAFQQMLLDLLPVFVSYIDHNQTYRFANKRYQDLFHIDPSDIVGRHPRDVMGHGPYEEVAHRHKAALAGEEQAYESSFEVAGGTRFHFRAHYLPHFLDNRVQGFLAIVQDITAYKKAEQALQESQALLEKANANLEALWRVARMTDASYDELCDLILDEILQMTQSEYSFLGFLDENEAFMNLHSWSGDAMRQCATKDQSLHFPIDQAGVWSQAVIDRNACRVNDYRAPHPRKRGLPPGHVPINKLLSVPILRHGKVFALAAVANKSHDYTREDERQIGTFVSNTLLLLEKKRSEEAMRESESRYRNLVDKLDDIIWVTDLDLRTIYVSPAIEKKLGFTSAERKAQAPEDQMTPESYARAVRLLFQALEAEKSRQEEPQLPIRVELEYYHKNGSARWFENVVGWHRNAQGDIVGLHGISRDITAAKKSQAELQASEQRFRLLAENATDMISIHSAEGRYLFASPACRSLMGFAPEELVGQDAYDFFHPDDLAQIKRSHQAVLADGVTYTVVYRIRRKDMRYVWVETNSRIITGDARGEVKEIIAVTRDISERKMAEDSLKASETSLRRLSTQLMQVQETERKRVSVELHDEFGQGLMVLKLQLRRARNRLADQDAEVAKGLEESLALIDEMTDNVRRLARELSPAALDDLGVSGAVRKLVEETLQHTKVNVELQIDDISCDPPKEIKITVYRVYQETLTNILKHANASRVTIRLKCRENTISGLVTDDGSGFDTERLSKESDADFGFGLKAMAERIGSVGGTINIESRAGAGTRMEFRIPLPECKP